MMSSNLSKETIFTTPDGDVRIRSFCRPDEIKKHEFDSEFDIQEDYKPLFTQRESLEKIAAHDAANVVLAFAENGNIIGLGVLADPDPQERWTNLGPGRIMEVKAIEVCRTWRSVGIASHIIRMLMDHARIDEMIIYMVGYSWTWDLKGTRKSGEEYRQILIKLFEPFGFKPYETNEPNVCLKPENILMARIGSNISQNIEDRFKWLRFDLNLWSWSVG